MSYYENLQLAIDYIEAHLKETVELKDIAKVTGYSILQVYRIFGAMVGYTVMEYVRKRRMSDALYGAPPQKIRKASIEPILFESVHLLSKQIKGDETMKQKKKC